MANRDHPAYEPWRAMRRRCAADHPNYGGRGIAVDARWNSFQLFLSDMGPRPSPAHSIERENVNVGYMPSNCSWATREAQARNRRDARKINGIPLKTLCEQKGLKYNTVLARILRKGLSPEEALR